MDEIWTHLWQLGTPFGMLGIAVVYFWKVNKALQDVIVKKDNTIENLNKELREFMQKTTETLHTTIHNNTTALNYLKDAWVNRNDK